MLITKGSLQSRILANTTRIVSHYMTLFLVLNHERVRYCNGLLKAKMITIDNITLPVIASTICKNASAFRMQKSKYSSAKEPISTHYANKHATWMLGTIKKQISSQLSKTNASIPVPIVQEVTVSNSL
jgi:hypothetical protein